MESTAPSSPIIGWYHEVFPGRPEKIRAQDNQGNISWNTMRQWLAKYLQRHDKQFHPGIFKVCGAHFKFPGWKSSLRGLLYFRNILEFYVFLPARKHFCGISKSGANWHFNNGVLLVSWTNIIFPSSMLQSSLWLFDSSVRAIMTE